MNSVSIIVKLIIILTFNGVIIPIKGQKTKCVDIPLQCIDYTSLILFSPFTLYRSNVEDFNCSHVAFTGYAGNNNNYTGTVILTNKKFVYTFDTTQISDSIFKSKLCRNGSVIDRRIIYSNLNCKARASYCVVTCDEKSEYINDIECFGRTDEDAIDLDNFLSTLTAPIKSRIINSRENCCKPQHCASFK